MNKLEKLLFAVASLMVASILYFTYIGHQRGGYEQNPIARFLFERLYDYTGSWALAIISFIPIVVAGLYLAVILIKRDYKDKNPRAGQFFLTAVIALITPNFISIVLNLNLNNRFIASAGILLAAAYLIYEWLKPKSAIKIQA